MSLFRVIECHKTNSFHIITFYEYYEQGRGEGRELLIPSLSEVTWSVFLWYDVENASLISDHRSMIARFIHDGYAYDH